ncbi:DUF1043 family protein [Salmonella enterica subsp. enterica]|nr:DUF1043 family protein [Salmonella enterica subsp. enterica]
MRFGNRKLRQQQALQYELEKTKLSWKSTVKSWLATLPAAPELLDTMAHDYRQLYQHMAKAPAACRKCLQVELRSVTVWQV